MAVHTSQSKLTSALLSIRKDKRSSILFKGLQSNDKKKSHNRVCIWKCTMLTCMLPQPQCFRKPTNLKITTNMEEWNDVWQGGWELSKKNFT